MRSAAFSMADMLLSLRPSNVPTECRHLRKFCPTERLHWCCRISVTLGATGEASLPRNRWTEAEKVHSRAGETILSSLLYHGIRRNPVSLLLRNFSYQALRWNMRSRFKRRIIRRVRGACRRGFHTHGSYYRSSEPSPLLSGP